MATKSTTEQKHDALKDILESLHLVSEKTWKQIVDEDTPVDAIHRKVREAITSTERAMNALLPTNFGKDTGANALMFCSNCKRLTWHRWGIVNHWRCHRCNERN